MRFWGLLVGGFAGGGSLVACGFLGWVAWCFGVSGCFGFRGLVWGLGLSVICFRVSCGFAVEGCLCLGDWFAS